MATIRPKRRRERKPLDFNNLPKALSPEQAAEVLNVSDDTYYRHVHPAIVRKEILSFMIGRQRRIITTSLLTWAEQQAKGAM